MTDFKVKNNGLVFSDGDLVTVDGLEEVKQHIVAALNTFKGDWILNRQKGINYPFGFRNTYFLEKDIRQQILGVQNVYSLDDFSMDFDKTTLAIKITAVIKTTFGNVTLNENLSTQT